jgi:uncharacterized protein YqhQ
MVLGVKSLMNSAELFDEEEGYKPSKMEAWLAEKLGRDIEDVIMFFALALAIVFAIGLFILLPAVLSGLIRPYVESSIAVNLTEGLVRLGIFLIYLILVSKMEDIRRIFEYHGAEHKTIHCYEHDEELTVENARKYTTLHPRCGTAFLLIVMVISIVVFSFMGWQNIFIRVLSRLMLLPLVAGLAYFNSNLFLGGAGCKGFAACASDNCLPVIRMDIWLHLFHLFILLMLISQNQILLV